MSLLLFWKRNLQPQPEKSIAHLLVKKVWYRGRNAPFEYIDSYAVCELNDMLEVTDILDADGYQSDNHRCERCLRIWQRITGDRS